ncbi:ankyrin repeat domain-containing protein [Salicola sp. Rm-C-2C1-2]|uniref:ankyrin repeat domain-containing protein n=1 Tax=Salicola sp. Rm-C-2C1-2 TaxID=3141321 RepID=UPI0032E4B357
MTSMLLDLPEALGNHRSLPSVNGGTPLERHKMDQVIAGIEYQKLALKLGADPNFPDDSGDTPVTMMAGGNDNEILRLLLEHGGDPNGTNRNGQPALFDAISEERWDNIKTLLGYGADPDLTDKTGTTSARYAARLNQFEIANYLISQGADPLQRDQVGADIAWTIHKRLKRDLIDPKSETYKWAQKVKQQLEERGVEFPPSSPEEVRERWGREGK